MVLCIDGCCSYGSCYSIVCGDRHEFSNNDTLLSGLVAGTKAPCERIRRDRVLELQCILQLKKVQCTTQPNVNAFVDA